jgi:hypothetical protein
MPCPREMFDITLGLSQASRDRDLLLAASRVAAATSLTVVATNTPLRQHVVR